MIMTQGCFTVKYFNNHFFISQNRIRIEHWNFWKHCYKPTLIHSLLGATKLAYYGEYLPVELFISESS